MDYSLSDNDGVILLFLFNVLIGGVAFHVFEAWASSRTSATIVAITFTFRPLAWALLSYAFLDDPLSLWVAVSAVLVVIGCLLFIHHSLSDRRRADRQLRFGELGLKYGEHEVENALMAPNGTAGLGDHFDNDTDIEPLLHQQDYQPGRFSRTSGMGSSTAKFATI